MKVYFGFLWLCCFVTGYIYPTQVICYPDDIYVNLLYVQLLDHVSTGSGVTPDGVNACINSDSAVNDTLSCAEAAGYSRRSIIKKTYQFAMVQNPVNMTVVEGLRLNLKQHLIFKRIIFWDTFVCATFSTLLSLSLLWFYTLYFKYDRRVIKHYLANSLSGYRPHPDTDRGLG